MGRWPAGPVGFPIPRWHRYFLSTVRKLRMRMPLTKSLPPLGKVAFAKQMTDEVSP